MTTKVAYFTITGGYLTKVARDLFLEDDPAGAWRFLSDSLSGGEPGEVDVLAREVLDGKMKLVGDSTAGIDVVEDSDEETKVYREEIKWLYAGRFRKEGQWWRPCARVVFGQEDARHAQKQTTLQIPTKLNPNILAMWWRNRVEFHARPNEKAFAVQPVNGRDSLILFEPAGEPPYWWSHKNKTSVEAYQDFCEGGRRLEVRDNRAFEEARQKDTRVTPNREEDQSATDAIEAERKERREEEDRRAAAYEQMVVDISTKVKEQAGTDTFEMVVGDRVLVIPRAPFWNWALRKTSIKHLAPPWNLVSESGVKLPFDDPYHTDWMLGAGIDLHDSYGGAVADRASDLMWDLQKELGNFEAAVLSEGRQVTGVVGETILVLPNLHPDWLDDALKSSAVITEKGGALAHLAVVAREHGLTIMRVEDAIKRYPKGTEVTLMPDEGRIVTHVKRLGNYEGASNG